MKTITRHGILVTVLLLLLVSCGKENAVSNLKTERLRIDTVEVLNGNVDKSPQCNVSFDMRCFKGEDGEKINRQLIASGIIMPEYVEFNTQPFNMKGYLKAFMKRYVDDYKKCYAPLYRVDPNHAFSYDLRYKVKTSIGKTACNLVPYIVETEYYGGGEHAVKQTIIRNIDVQSKQVVAIGDIVDDDNFKQLNDIIVQELCSQSKCVNLVQLREKDIFADGRIYPSDNFLVDKDHLTLIYGEGEIAPSEIKIQIKKKKLKDILKDSYK